MNLGYNFDIEVAVDIDIVVMDNKDYCRHSDRDYFDLVETVDLSYNHFQQVFLFVRYLYSMELCSKIHFYF